MLPARPPDLFCILYHSREALPASAAQAGTALARILETSTANNARDGVTGVLMFGHGSFVQVLEGPEAAVRACLDRILGDRRHRDVTVLHMGRVDERAFPAWSMAAIPDWDGSDRTRAVLEAVKSRTDAPPTRTNLLNFLLGMLLRQAGRDWKPLADRMALAPQA